MEVHWRAKPEVHFGVRRAVPTAPTQLWGGTTGRSEEVLIGQAQESRAMILGS